VEKLTCDVVFSPAARDAHGAAPMPRDEQAAPWTLSFDGGGRKVKMRHNAVEGMICELFP